jgi:hypothetical protein
MTPHPSLKLKLHVHMPHASLPASISEWLGLRDDGCNGDGDGSSTPGSRRLQRIGEDNRVDIICVGLQEVEMGTASVAWDAAWQAMKLEPLVRD